MPTSATSASGRSAWPGSRVVMPALTLNYFGQGALLLENPEAVKNPFFMMAPEWALIPLVLLATRGHGDRLAGAHHRRLQRHAAGDPARLLAAPATSSTPACATRGPDLRPLRQLGPVRRHRAGGRDVPLVEQPGGGLRHRGHHRHADHHRADLLRDPLRLEVPAGAVHRRHRLVLRRRLPVLRLQPAQAVRGRLVPAADRRRHLHADADLEGGPQADGQAPARRRHRPARASSPRSSSTRRRASPAPRCS